RVRYPAQNTSLCLDHCQAHLLKLREIRSHTVLQDEAVIAPIVGFANRRMDADFGGHPGDNELLDGTILEKRVQVSGEEGAFAWLVNHWLGREGREFWNDVMSGFTTHQNASIGNSNGLFHRAFS